MHDGKAVDATDSFSARLISDPALVTASSPHHRHACVHFCITNVYRPASVITNLLYLPNTAGSISTRAIVVGLEWK